MQVRSRAPRRAAAVLSTLVAVLSGLGLAAVPTAPAHAAGEPYVALGDSYSSGTGTRSYLADGTSCLRSAYAFPSLLAAQRSYRLNFRACSGARVADVTNNQVGALSGTTRFVTLSIGGNDAGFADVLTECAQPGWMSDCGSAIDGAQAFIRGTLPGRLRALYAAIRSRAPQATVVVVGYPRLFMGEDCNAFTWFSPEEQTRLNRTADLLNSTTSSLAAAAGFRFADPTGRFSGHAVCDDPEWVNGLSNPVVESYHPNRLGHSSGYTPLVSPVLTGSVAALSEADVARAEAAAGELARQQRKYAAADRSIRPEVFEVPDMDGPEARRAAKAAGIDLGAWLAAHRG